MKAAKDLLSSKNIEIKPTERTRPSVKQSPTYLLDMDWKDSKSIIDLMTEDELLEFAKVSERIKQKKIALINLRVTAHEYALVKLLADRLKRPNASQALLELTRSEILGD